MGLLFNVEQHRYRTPLPGLKDLAAMHIFNVFNKAFPGFGFAIMGAKSGQSFLSNEPLSPEQQQVLQDAYDYAIMVQPTLMGG